MITEELVGWVDEDEQLIKAIPISLANSDPKYLHSEIALMIYDDQGNILLQERAKTKRVHPGLWTTTVAGHITHGDTANHTAHKELREEMGFDVSQITYLFREKISITNETHFAHWFLGKYEGGDIIVEPKEVSGYQWVGQKDLPAFTKQHQVSERTVAVANRFWSGEWNHLIK